MGDPRDEGKQRDRHDTRAVVVVGMGIGFELSTTAATTEGHR